MIRRDIEPQPGCVIALASLAAIGAVAAVLAVAAVVVRATHEAFALIAVGLLVLFSIHLSA